MLINYRKRYLQFQFIWTSTLVILTFGFCLNDEFYDFLLLRNDLTATKTWTKLTIVLLKWLQNRKPTNQFNCGISKEKKIVNECKIYWNVPEFQYFEILFSTIHLLQCTYKHAYKPDTTLQLIKKSRRQIQKVKKTKQSRANRLYARRCIEMRIYSFGRSEIKIKHFVFVLYYSSSPSSVYWYCNAPFLFVRISVCPRNNKCSWWFDLFSFCFLVTISLLLLLLRSFSKISSIISYRKY